MNLRIRRSIVCCFSIGVFSALLMPAAYAAPRAVTVIVVDNTKYGSHPVHGATVYAKDLDFPNVYKAITNARGEAHLSVNLFADAKQRLCFEATHDGLQAWERPCFTNHNLPATVNIRLWKP